MTTFNLVDQPWIPVLTALGEYQRVSIQTALTRAKNFTRIAAELPTASIAIQRLLQAILMRVAQPLPRAREDRAALWSQWWEAGGAPGCEIEQYLERWHDRFDLLHPQTPFFQVPGLSLKSGGGSGLDKIIADVPAGTKFFTTRAGESLRRLSFADAAIWLVHAQAFDCAGIKSGVLGDDRVKGGKSYSFGYPAWAGNLGIVSLEGNNLAETLLLNLDLAATGTDDSPAWETAPQRIASDGIYPAPVGAAQAWTWPSRMIRLITKGDDVVDVVLSNGEKLTPQNRHAVEPMTSWKRSEAQSKKLGGDDVFMPVGHDPKRAAWRGLSGLLAQNSMGDTVKREAAGVLKWLGTLNGEGLIPDGFNVRLRCVAMFYGSQASTFSEDFDDSVDMRVAMLASAELRRLAVDAVDAARRAVMALRDFAQNLERAAGDSGDGLAEKAQALETDVYDQLRAPFERWLQTLDDSADEASAAVRWERAVDQIIRRSADEYARRCPAAAVLGRTVRLGTKDIHMDLGQALIFLHAALHRELPLAKRTTTTTTQEGGNDGLHNTTDQ